MTGAAPWSPPARWLRPGALLRSLAGGGRPRPGVVNHVSLGTVCHMASVLRGSGLRLWTGPFDWVLSTPALVADCLREDFRSYLDPALLRSVPEGERIGGARRQCRHPTIEARYGVPILFNHHDPARSAADREALTRAVARLRAALGGGHANVFYLMAVDHELSGPEVDLLSRVLAAFPARSTLVQVTVTIGGGDGRRAVRVEEGPDAALPGLSVRLRAGSAWRGLGFADPADDALLRQGVREAAAAMAARLAAGHPGAGPGRARLAGDVKHG